MFNVGEPDCPVAATERGRRVPVRAEEYMTVADHDFTKFGIVPSVILLFDLPEEISESWYRGQYLLLPKRLFLSLPHLSGMLVSCIKPQHFCRSIRKCYSYILMVDQTIGSHVSVQLSLICLFLKLDLAYLCAGRTAPYHSWRNPVERIMYFGLQCWIGQS